MEHAFEPGRQPRELRTHLGRLMHVRLRGSSGRPCFRAVTAGPTPRFRAARVWTVLAATALLLPTACARGDVTTGDSRPTTQPVDYHRPGEAVEAGTGSLAEMSLDGAAAYVEETDPRFSVPGCEGQSEPVMFRLPLSGGTREVLGAGKEPLNGAIVRGKRRRVAVVSSCEEFFSGLLVGAETADGHLTDLREVTLQRGDDEPPPSPNTFAWSLDGRHVLTAVNEATAEKNPVPLMRIDPSTGATSRVFDVPDTVGITQVDQLADGTYVLAGDKVTLRNGAGAVTDTFDGNGFALSPDRRRIAVFGRALALVTPGGPEPATLVPPESDRQITSATFSPDGRAIAYLSRADDNTSTVSIVTPADARVTKIAGPGPLSQPLFSGDGKHLAFNEYGGDALHFVAKLRLVSFDT